MITMTVSGTNFETFQLWKRVTQPLEESGHSTRTWSSKSNSTHTTTVPDSGKCEILFLFRPGRGAIVDQNRKAGETSQHRFLRRPAWSKQQVHIQTGGRQKHDTSPK